MLELVIIKLLTLMLELVQISNVITNYFSPKRIALIGFDIKLMSVIVADILLRKILNNINVY